MDRFTSQPGDWSGNVYDFYYRVYNKLKQALKVPFKLDGDMHRVDDTSAHRALREAIANCLTNANYYDRRGIVCVWRQDAIVIENPGDFRMPISEARKPGKSDPRNETMLKIFGFVNVGERAGSGLTTIFDGWREAGYAEPYFDMEFGPDRTILTLPLVPESAGICQNPAEEDDEIRQNPPELAGKGGNWPERAGTGRKEAAELAGIRQNWPERAKTGRKEAAELAGNGENWPGTSITRLNSSDQRVYEHLGSNGSCGAGSIAASLDMPTRTVRNALNRLQNAGLVERLGSGRSTVYRLMP